MLVAQLRHGDEEAAVARLGTEPLEPGAEQVAVRPARSGRTTTGTRRAARGGSPPRPRRSCVERLDLVRVALVDDARLTFSVGVSSPSAWVRSWSRIAKRLICSMRAKRALAASTSASSSACTRGSRGHAPPGRARCPSALGQRRRLVGVEREQRHEVGPVVAVRRRPARSSATRAARASMFAGVMFLPLGGDDEVLLAPGDAQEAVVVDRAQVAGEQPAVVERSRAVASGSSW